MNQRLHSLIVITSLLLTTAGQKASAQFSSNGLATSPISNPTERKSSTTENWQAAALHYIEKSDYFFKAFDKNFAFANRKQQLNFSTSGLTLTTSPMDKGPGRSNWHSSILLTGIGGVQCPASLTPGSVQAKEQYLKFSYPGFAIEYINDDHGLRQNFIVDKKTGTGDNLKISLRFSGGLVPALQGKNILVLKDPLTSKKILQYDDLKVWDSRHRVLDASMQLTAANELQLMVDDADAVYPITIDPLTHVPDWATSANGILPALLVNTQLQVDALYGYTVEGVGDVNNDGYDDVAIGAPGAIDIIAGPSTIVGAGAVFVYFGSATGLPVVPSRILRATTSVTNALFGYSVGSGNVTGSIGAGMVNNDIIVGAPGESYLADVGGLPATATVTAGKVYIFDGAQLQAGPANPLLSIYLNGAGLLSNGLAGVLGVNTNVNALFGFAVAGTEDMDGDGRGEVIVGAPGYKGVGLVDVRSGGAFIYRSGGLVSNTANSLTPPSLTSFPLLINLDGLLFGFSVDGVGDYDKDSRPDVVVGAPGGLNLGVPGFLGGSAYVYTGNGAGVNTTIKTQLAPSTPFLGAVANLFGYDVKGARNAAGVRTGNIIVGAPAGNVLSNVTGGLRLKTGSVYVFAAKPTPGITESSLQSFSSPRGANLLAQLLSLNIDVTALFGVSIDNMRDVNCDGIADLIVGEPLSTGVGLVSANAVGGAAYIFTGNANGTYNTPPFWTLENTVSFDFGINAGSLLGYSVAGAGFTNGPFESTRALVGAPGAALDFSTGILNLGNTVGTLYSFLAVNNGLGKAYSFAFGCRYTTHPDFGVTYVNVPLTGNTNTNDDVPANAQYGTPVASPTNPAGATIGMNPDGTYNFTATAVGVYVYAVPVCTPEGDCMNSLLTITVLAANNSVQPPVANTDIGITNVNTAVSVQTLANDEAGYIGGSLNPGSVTIIAAPDNGVAVANPATGVITYTPANGFTGQDTLVYQVCDNSATPLCAIAIQVFTVQPANATNATLAADDFNYIAEGNIASGNVTLNDTDPELNAQAVTPQNITVAAGTLILNANGDYTFSPAVGFNGPISFVYTTCDNGLPQACASATLYILVLPLSTTPVDITDFSSHQQACNIRLNWQTNTELNTRNFEIEFSADNGRTFTTAGSVTARGNNSSYSFNYLMKNEVSHIFRLKAIDHGGAVTYSEMLSIRSGCATGKSESYVFPSPASTVLNLRVNDASLLKTEATVYDMNGKKMMTVKVSSSQVRMNVAFLVPGIYLIKLNDGTSMKFVKQ